MKTDELREMYLSFFESKGCTRRPSDVLVPKEDNTVLFTPAGMNQFKNEFLGIGQLEFTKATTCQKCVRTGDISNVGVTAYHHTFFEMLGNFSFGDYFKKEAIHWAWEFLTEKKWLGLDKDKLTVTVYLDDDEAYNIWHDEIKLSADRIRRDNEDENFWPAGAPSQGPDGVCGPCSEIFFHPPDGSGEVEIWNLVFTQFNRVGDPPDNLRPLPKNNIDTGMGLERTAAVLQGVQSNFEIDILKPLCLAAADIVGVNYEFGAKEGRPLRRIADHTRAITFCLHEGVIPSASGAGYTVKLLLRRAMLEGYLLGKTSPFLYQLVPNIAEVMRNPYPELGKSVAAVQAAIQAEEEHFLHTIERGLRKFTNVVEKTKKAGDKKISGDVAFDLHQTDGFLIELVEALAPRDGLKVDRDRFNQLMKEHGEKSKGGGFEGVMAAGPLDDIRNTHGDTEFLGYETTEEESQIVGMISENTLSGEISDPDTAVGILLESTPFYGESGGQVGDTGTLTGPNGTFEVKDTQKEGGLVIHIGHLTSGSLKVGEKVQAQVKEDRRAGILRAHSATHLLHHALRLNLGENAMQRGSKVEDDVLRFDFSHGSSISRDDLIKIEDEINARIAEGAGVEIRFMNIDEAREAGAMALFGEKYPDRVRVVSMGDFSKELCGGTHLTNTGQVGLCKIITEESVSSGVRRIVALTGPKALERIRQTEDLVKELAVMLKAPQAEDLPRRVTHLQDELRETKKELAKQTSKGVAGLVDELITNAEEVNGVKIISHQPDNATRESLREFVDQLRSKASQVAVILGAEVDGKVALIAAVSKDLIQQGVKANDCIKVAAKVAGGGGGGRPDMAEAGGSKPDKIGDALQTGVEFYREQLAK